MLAFALPNEIKSEDFHKRLREKHSVQLKVVPKNWPNGNRVSTHLFDTEQDVDTLVAALKLRAGPALRVATLSYRRNRLPPAPNREAE